MKKIEPGLGRLNHVMSNTDMVYTLAHPHSLHIFKIYNLKLSNLSRLKEDQNGPLKRHIPHPLPFGQSMEVSFFWHQELYYLQHPLTSENHISNFEPE